MVQPPAPLNPPHRASRSRTAIQTVAKGVALTSPAVIGRLLGSPGAILLLKRTPVGYLRVKIAPSAPTKEPRGERADPSSASPPPCGASRPFSHTACAVPSGRLRTVPGHGTRLPLAFLGTRRDWGRSGSLPRVCGAVAAALGHSRRAVLYICTCAKREFRRAPSIDLRGRGSGLDPSDSGRLRSHFGLSMFGGDRSIGPWVGQCGGGWLWESCGQGSGRGQWAAQQRMRLRMHTYTHIYINKPGKENKQGITISKKPLYPFTSFGFFHAYPQRTQEARRRYLSLYNHYC